MFSSRLLPASVLCVALAAGATACGGSKGSSGTAAAAASPSAVASSTTSGAPASPASAAPAVPGSPSAPAAPGSTGPDLSSMTAKQISDAAKKALEAADSVRIAGNMTTDGTAVTFDVSSSKNKDCDGTFTIGETGSVEVIRLGGSTWMKPDSVFWHYVAEKEGHPDSGAQLAELFKGRYLTGAQDDPGLKDVADMCDMVDQLTQDDNSAGDTDTKGATSTINGQSALTLQVSSDDGTHGQLYVATQGTPYPLRMVAKSDTDHGQIDFRDFDKPLNLQAPPADQVIDYSQFQKKVRSV